MRLSVISGIANDVGDMHEECFRNLARDRMQRRAFSNTNGVEPFRGELAKRPGWHRS